MAKPDADTIDEALEDGDLESIRLLLGAVRKFDATQALDALARRSSDGHVAIAELLLTRGANPKWADKDNYTLLNSAVTHDRLELAKWLVAHGASMLQNPKGGRADLTPLAQACNYASVAMVDFVLEQGVDVRGEDATKALLWAIEKKRRPKAVRLIKAGVDPNRAARDATPLQLAAETGQHAVVEALLAHGADANAPSDKPPLLGAIKKNRLGVLRALLLHQKTNRLAKVGKKSLQELGEASKNEAVRALFGMNEAQLKGYVEVRKTLEFVNHRSLLEEGSPRWEPHITAQMKKLFGKATDAELKKRNDGGEVELVDVVDGDTGAIEYQMYLYPYGDGAVFAHGKTSAIAEICQHSMDITKSMPDDKKADLLDLFQDAYARFKGKLGQSLSF